MTAMTAITGPAPSRPSRGGLLKSAARIFDLSLGQMLWSRRSIFLGLLLGGPILIAGVLRIVDTLYRAGFQINGARTSGSIVFGLMIWILYIRFIVPVLGVFYGTALIADEVDDKTITYLFTRPIKRMYRIQIISQNTIDRKSTRLNSSHVKI